MANTYTQLYIQVVFAVKNQKNTIPTFNKERVEQYICGIAENIKCAPISIYCNPDHVHFLFSLHPSISVSDTVRDIKSFSSRFINDNKLTNGHFEWQTGFGAFSYGRSQVNDVCAYIQNQSEHHKKVTFKDEYKAFLKAFDIEFNEEYLFDY